MPDEDPHEDVALKSFKQSSDIDHVDAWRNIFFQTWKTVKQCSLKHFYVTTTFFNLVFFLNNN